MRLFGGEKMLNMFNSLNVPDNEPIEHKMLSSAIERAQKRIEGNNFGIRKALLEYDQVKNEQREIIYAERRKVLDGENMRGVIMNMISDVCDGIVQGCIGEDASADEWDLTELNQSLLPIVPIEPITYDVVKDMKKNDLKQYVKEQAVRLYEEKEAMVGNDEKMREIERVVLLRSVDRRWMNHIDDMEQLRQGIGLQAYGNKNPVVEYKMQGFDMFEAMTAGIQDDTVQALMHIRAEQKVEREQVAKAVGTNRDDSVTKAPVKRAEVKIYPNSPCPCGSGKKYKQCHGRPGAPKLQA